MAHVTLPIVMQWAVHSGRENGESANDLRLFPGSLFLKHLFPGRLFLKGLFSGILFPQQLFPRHLFLKGLFSGSLFLQHLVLGRLFLKGLFPGHLFLKHLFLGRCFLNIFSLEVCSLNICSREVCFLKVYSMDVCGLFPGLLFLKGLFPESLFIQRLFPGRLFLNGLFPGRLFLKGLFPGSLFLKGLFLRRLLLLNSSLTPSLPQPVRFPGWKMHGRTCKQYIFRSYNTSTFNAMRFDEILSHASAKKKTKRLKGFKFRTFNYRFQVTSWQWRVKYASAGGIKGFWLDLWLEITQGVFPFRSTLRHHHPITILHAFPPWITIPSSTVRGQISVKRIKRKKNLLQGTRFVGCLRERNRYARKTIEVEHDRDWQKEKYLREQAYI